MTRDPHSRRLYYLYGMDQYDLTDGAHPQCPPRLLRHDLLHRRPGGRTAACVLETDRPAGRHDRGADRRPRRHAGRAWHVVQNVVFRTVDPCPAADPLARDRFAARDGSRRGSHCSICCRLWSILRPTARNRRRPRPCRSTAPAWRRSNCSGDDEADTTVIGEYLAEATPGPDLHGAPLAVQVYRQCSPIRRSSSTSPATRTN